MTTMPRNLIEMVNDRCRKDANKTAFLVKKDGKWNPVTWGEVDRRVERIAAGLRALGVQTGDRISIMGNTRLEWTLADLGVLRAGGVSVGIYHTLSEEQIAYILKDSGSTVLFVENRALSEKVQSRLAELPELKYRVCWDDNLESADALRLEDLEQKGESFLAETPGALKTVEKEIQPDDIAIIIYTSGTTGPPKGACLSHKNILAQIDLTGRLITDEQLGDIMMFFLPLSHVGERVPGQFVRIHRGVTAAYVNDINRILEDIVEIKPTFFGSVPRVFEKAYARIQSEVAAAPPLKQKIFRWAEAVGRETSRHLQAGRDLPPVLRVKQAIADRLVFKKIRGIFGGRVRFFLSSSAPIAVEILEFFHACGMLVLEGYGQTEVSCFCNLCTPDAYRFGSVGRAMPEVDIKIAEDGEIMVKGDIVFKGYFNQPELTRKTITDDGWIYTGDLGRIDDDGYLWITGRKKEIIVTSGGKNVTPSNIERLLMNHPLIELAMVHGDRRNYLTVLLSLSPDTLKGWAETHGCPDLEFERLIVREDLKEEIQKHVDEVNKHLARYETIKKFAFVPRPFQVETGELTPTMKVKRGVVEQKYKDLLDRLYV